jgi:CRISPR/Cas system-associated exonuclease Cas4 (RecB family)
MSHYGFLTVDEQADRERSLMDKARVDERAKVLKEIKELLEGE